MKVIRCPTVIIILCILMAIVEGFEPRIYQKDKAMGNDEARTYCETNFYQGRLATWEDIKEHDTVTRTGPLQVWDGHLYQISPLISIRDCTEAAGLEQHELPPTVYWSVAAAHCQGFCPSSSFYALKNDQCFCLDGSYDTIDDSLCLKQLQRTPLIEEGDVKTVFQTVTSVSSSSHPGYDDQDKGCLAKKQGNSCQRDVEFEKCNEKKEMLCKDNTAYSRAKSWRDAAYGCIQDNKKFPIPVLQPCTSNPARWLGGFRDLQYATGSSGGGSLCRKITYNGNSIESFKTEACNKDLTFFCRFAEQGYEESCDNTLTLDVAACRDPLSCTSADGRHVCLCPVGRYWDQSVPSCITRHGYNRECNPDIPDVCTEAFSCLPQDGGGYKCLCDDGHYYADNVCNQVLSYSSACTDDFQCTRSLGLLCFPVGDTGNKACVCPTEAYWDPNVSRCFIKGSFKEPCPGTITNSCKSTLECIDDVCACRDTEYWLPGDGNCHEKGSFKEACPGTITNSCNSTLECIDDVCACRDTEYWLPGDGNCHEKGSFKEACPGTITNSCNSTLECIDDVCACRDTEYWLPGDGNCHEKGSFKEPCPGTITNSCKSTLKCIDDVCACRDTKYWLPGDENCHERSSFRQTCPGITDSCKSNLDCIDDVCACRDKEYWLPGDGNCHERKKYKDSCTPDTTDICSSGLVCRDTNGQSRCVCGDNGLYIDGTCQGGPFTPILVQVSQTYKEANVTCFNSNSYVADDVHFEQILKEGCINTSEVLFSGLQKYVKDPSPTECATMQAEDDKITYNKEINCTLSFPFICIRKELSTDNMCKGVGTTDINKPDVEEQNADRDEAPVIIIVLCAVGVVLGLFVILVIVGVYMKRKRATQHSKDEQKSINFNQDKDEAVITVHESINNYDLVTENDQDRVPKAEGIDFGYGGLGQSPNTPEGDMYAHARQQPTEGDYDSFAKPPNTDVSDIYDHTRPMDDGQYGVLGPKPKIEVDNDDVYSHTQRSNAEGDYDSFTKPQATTNDQDDEYDITHNIMMESAYDEFQQNSRVADVEGVYDQT